MAYTRARQAEGCHEEPGHAGSDVMGSVLLMPSFRGPRLGMRVDAQSPSGLELLPPSLDLGPDPLYSRAQ